MKDEKKFCLRDYETDLYGETFFLSLLPHLSYPDLLPLSFLLIRLVPEPGNVRQNLLFGKLLKKKEEDRLSIFRLDTGDFVVVMAKTRRNEAGEFLEELVLSVKRSKALKGCSLETVEEELLFCDESPEKVFWQMQSELEDRSEASLRYSVREEELECMT